MSANCDWCDSSVSIAELKLVDYRQGFGCERCRRQYEGCDVCGGSGGGSEPSLRCSACNGTGLAPPEPISQ